MSGNSSHFTILGPLSHRMPQANIFSKHPRLLGSSPSATMNSYHYYSSSFFYFSEDDKTTPPYPKNTISVPIDAPSHATLTPIPVRFPGPDPAVAASVKIQSAFRGHLVRRLVGTIRAVDAEAGRIECRIRQQETVDAVRRDDRERLRVGESLMSLLLRLDAVPGFYPAVGELRRAASRRIVGIQEVLDAIVGAPAGAGGGAEGFPSSWEEMVEGICRGKGRGEEEESERVGAWEGGFQCWEWFTEGV